MRFGPARRLALLLALAALAVVGTASTAAAACVVPAAPVRLPSQGVKLGLVAGSLLDYAGHEAKCAQVTLVREAGARLVRQEIAWARVSPERDVLRWDEVDVLFATAARQGMTVLPLLDGTPAWARPAANGLPGDRGAFGRFVAAFVGRYGPAGRFWKAHPELPHRPATWTELFNETYLPPGRPDPVAYARLVRTAVTAGRRANARARFLIAADTTWLDEDYHIVGDWLPALYAAVPGFGRYYDALAVHPYSSRPPATTGSAEASRELNRRVEDIDATLGALGDGAKKLWITEIGWSTCATRPNCLDEERQARYLSDFVRLSRTRWRGFIDTVIVYTLHSFATEDEVQADFGLLRRDGTRKPGWLAFRRAALQAFRGRGA